MEISFSPNYLDYDWTVNVQLVSQAGSSLQMNGMDWDGVDHPNDRTTWFESDLKRISAGTYTMESSAKVNAATIAGTFLTGTDSEGTGNLVVLLRFMLMTGWCERKRYRHPRMESLTLSSH